MSDEAPQPTEVTQMTNKEILAKMAEMSAELERLKTNPHNLVTTTICNVCGDKVDERCPKHPNDVTNHIREGLPGERPFVLVKQV